LLLDRAEEEEETKELAVMEEEKEEGNGAISLHTIKGATNSKIIKVEEKMQDSSLMVLIDSGSTHNFIDEAMAKRMRHPTTRTQPLSLTIVLV